MLLTVFFISIMFVNALSPSDCNPSGQIYCTNTDSCLSGGSTLPSTKSTCTVDTTQVITLNQHTYFNFDTFTITNVGYLRFISTGTIIIPTIIPEFGYTITPNTGGSGSGEPPNTACAPADGRYGGWGGSGGGTLRKGSDGYDGNCGSGIIADGGTAGNTGSYITIYADNFVNDGELSVSGYSGEQGDPAYTDRTNGCNGGGGAGGSGGGIMVVFVSNSASGNGKITANGGNGGEGGLPTDDCGDRCGSCGDHGGGGGNGGGGGAGIILVSTSVSNSGIDLEAKKGLGTFWNCGSNGQSCSIAINGYTNIQSCYCQGSPKAGDGQEAQQVVFGDESNNCNDGEDNDFDGYYDMEDYDCFYVKSRAEKWDAEGGIINLSNYNPPGIDFSTLGTTYNPSAKDGSDLVCGDDPGDILLFDEPFNDNSNGWYMPPATQPIIEDGFLKLITPDTFRIVKPFTTKSKVTFTIKDNPTTYSSILTVFFVMDDGETGFFINNDNITLEGCTPLRVVGDPNRMHGIMLPSGTPGTDRSCNITVNDVRLKYLRYMVYQTEGEAWVNYITVSLPLNGGDYGYVTPDNKYLCYNNKSNFYGGTTDKWMWISARQSPFIITPLNFSGKTVDYISNSENWYYCDANPTPSLTGLQIPEYGSFPAPASGNYSLTNLDCSIAAYYITDTYHYSCLEGFPCCYDTTPVDIINNPGSILGCDCKSDAGSQTLPFCELYPLEDVCNSNFGTERVLTAFCKENPANCVTLNMYDPTRPCNDQPFDAGLNGECDVNQLCVNGVYLNVSGTPPMCCMGLSPEKHCADKSTIIDENSCDAAGGDYYALNNDTFCLPESQNILLSGASEGYGCCFGVIIYKSEFIFSEFESVNNNTFSCFAYQGDNHFGQCCYGACDSFGLFGVALDIDYTRNRVFSLKSAYNVQSSYDSYNSNLGAIDDFSMKNTPPATSSLNHSLKYLITFKPQTDLDYYSYISFDVLFDDAGAIGNLFINDVYYGRFTQFLAGGYFGGVPHRAIIPIKQENKGQFLDTIKIELYGQPNLPVEITYDNIQLVVDGEVTETSLNRYCTGGFGAWISQLDPPITDPANAFFVGDDAWIYGYGRYAASCDAILPFGWTGHYCCGDDTNTSNYGEYYEDTSNPTWPNNGGCFAGTKIDEKTPVWKEKGIIEDYSKFYKDTDELKIYPYSDLIYFDDSFLGCQVPNTKYDWLRESLYGQTPSGSSPLLINNFENNQCAVVGKYYCMNGIWRQYVPGLGQYFNTTYYEYYPSIPSTLELKSVPPATNLIKNSDFGGECPITICIEQGNNTQTG